MDDVPAAVDVEVVFRGRDVVVVGSASMSPHFRVFCPHSAADTVAPDVRSDGDDDAAGNQAVAVEAAVSRIELNTPAAAASVDPSDDVYDIPDSYYVHAAAAAVPTHQYATANAVSVTAFVPNVDFRVSVRRGLL